MVTSSNQIENSQSNIFMFSNSLPYTLAVSSKLNSSESFVLAWQALKNATFGHHNKFSSDFKLPLWICHCNKKIHLPHFHSIPVGVLAYRFSLSYLKRFRIYEVPKVIENLFGSCNLPILLDMTKV